MKPVKPHTILWADNDPDDLDLFEEIIKEFRAHTRTLMYSDGSEILEHLKASDPADYPCLIVLDMNMPVMDGRRTLTHLKSDDSFKNIPTVVFTTSSNPADHAYCMYKGAEMITKPPSYDRLKEVIRRFVYLCECTQ